ncbi:hypothetical protein ACHOLT_19950 [Desulfitobacterium sp. Sab5]|uniref:hypothetical protein n=1 Tax=Desulfitobacterium nosdiversum TaxID=3375356 RepID=UPI003CF47314
MSLVNNANRDVFVGEIANNLTKEKEIALFGFAYYEKGNIQYYFSTDETNAFVMQHHKITGKIICTPIKMITQKSSILTQSQIECQLQDILQQKYPKDYFSFLTYFNDLESNNLAEPILVKYFNSFTHETNMDLQQSNYNLVNFAYYSKQLNKSSYFKLLEKTRSIEIDELQIINRLDYRHLAGIGYFLPNEIPVYYSNAYLPNVFKKRAQLEKENYIISSIFRKSYDLADIKNNSIKEVKKDFTRILEQTINSNYMAVIQELKSLSPVISHLLFHNRLNKMKLNLTEDALQAIETYARMWNCN